MNRKLYIAACASLMLAACAGAAVTSLPYATDAHDAWQAQPSSTRTIGLGLPGGSMLAQGVTYAGGVQLLTPTVSPLRSLSDLKLVGDDEFITVSDSGDLVRGRLRLDDAGNLAGLDALRSRRLTALDSRAIEQKADGDAEGLALLANGDLLVSFEGDHRIWNYGTLDAITAPKPVPHPLWDFARNGGMEGLAAHQNKWRVAGEDGGVWDCDPLACLAVSLPSANAPKDSDYRTTGLDRDPSGQGYWVVQRAFTPPMDARARVRRMGEDGQLGPVLVELKLPGTTDNFEGIAATVRGDKTRIYILSDDNQNPLQRTLMLAFDIQR